MANILICKKCNGLGYKARLYIVKRKCKRCRGKGKIKIQVRNAYY